MEEFGAVLGVNWLSTLGLINWDFERMVIQFSYEGKAVALQGMGKALIQHPTVYSLSFHGEADQPLLQLLQDIEALFDEPLGL